MGEEKKEYLTDIDRMLDKVAELKMELRKFRDKFKLRYPYAPVVIETAIDEVNDCINDLEKALHECKEVIEETWWML